MYQLGNFEANIKWQKQNCYDKILIVDSFVPKIELFLIELPNM